MSAFIGADGRFHDGFTPLAGRLRRRAVVSVSINPESADALRVEATKDGALQVSCSGPVTLKLDAATNEGRAVNPRLTAGVNEITLAEDGACVISAIVEPDGFAFDVSIAKFHSASPVVGSTSTVAEAGGAASGPGGGLA